MGMSRSQASYSLSTSAADYALGQEEHTDRGQGKYNDYQYDESADPAYVNIGTVNTPPQVRYVVHCNWYVVHCNTLDLW